MSLIMESFYLFVVFLVSLSVQIWLTLFTFALEQLIKIAIDNKNNERSPTEVSCEQLHLFAQLTLRIYLQGVNQNTSYSCQTLEPFHHIWMCYLKFGYIYMFITEADLMD